MCDDKIDPKLAAWLRGENEFYTQQAMQTPHTPPTRAQSYANVQAVYGRKRRAEPRRYEPPPVSAPAPWKESPAPKTTSLPVSVLASYDEAASCEFLDDECTASRYDSLTACSPSLFEKERKIVYAQAEQQDLDAYDIEHADDIAPTPIRVKKAPPPERDARLMAVNKFGHIIGYQPPMEAPAPVPATPVVTTEPVEVVYKTHAGAKRVPASKLVKRRHTGKRPQRGVNVTGTWPTTQIDRMDRFTRLEVGNRDE